MLDPDVGADALVEPPRHVPGHHHVVGDVQRGVGHDAVGELEARALEPSGGRDDADPDDHDVAVEHTAVVEHDAGDALTVVRRSQGAHADLGEKLDVVVDVQCPAGRSHFRPQHARQGLGQCLDHRDARPEPTTRGGHLGPDEARPDHDDPGVLHPHRAPQCEGVFEGPQRVDTRQWCRAGQRAGVSPGGQHESVESHRAAVVELHGVTLDVEASGAVSEAEVETECGDLLRRSQQHAVEPPLAGQELLGQRGAVVGEVRLGPYEDDGAVMSVGPQRLRGPQSGQRCAHDDDGGSRGHAPNIAIHCSGERRRKT